MKKSNEVIYQIFPRNYSLEGKFANITNDLPRLKELGVDIIYLMPINEIGQVHRKGIYGSPYANRDYLSISSDLGTLDDFHCLCHETHKLGMKIILDMVFNHTAPDNTLVKEHPEYYFYKEGKRGNRIGDWSDIVDLDVTRDDTQEYLISVLVYWIQQGVDGFRFDVATMIPLSFFKRAREKLGGDVVFLAESIDTSFYNWLVSQGFYATKDEDMVPTFDLLYNYHWFREFESYLKYGDPLERTVDILNKPTSVIRVNCLENHDNDRIAHLVKNSEVRNHNVHAFSFFLNGDAFLYMGEEYGIDHKPELFEKDPIDWKKKDKALNEFIKKLIALKHADKSSCSDTNQVSLINQDSIKIMKGAMMGLFHFSTQPVSYLLEEGKYLDLLSGEDITGGQLTITEPLILVRKSDED